MDLIGGLRRRMSGMVMVGIMAAGTFICGAFMAFFLSPQAALEWRHIESMPVLDANGYSALKAGDEAVLTGTLQDNDTLTPDGLVAYEKSEWDVTESSTSNSSTPSEPKGSWKTIETKVPELSLSITGGMVQTQSVTSTDFGGDMHKTIERSSRTLVANADGEMLPDQSIRTQGFANGDLVTMVGKKAVSGALIPGRMFGGDKAQLVDYIRTQAQLLFTIGVGAMICSPIMLIVGVGGVIFGRRRGLFG